MEQLGQVNIAVQVLPKSQNKDTYQIVDKAIELISASGFKYEVCPFETVIEGPYNEVMELVKQIQLTCYKHGAEGLITNIKIQSNALNNVTIDDKIGKYRKTN